MTTEERTTQNIRSSKGRALGDVQEFEIDLYIDLQYVNEVLASELESMDPSNANVLHFCNSCILQVSYFLTCLFLGVKDPI